MAKFMVTGNYTSEGTQGLLAEGGTKRVETVKGMVEKLGGSVEAFYYAFGESDVVLIVDAPDNVTAAALSMAVNSSGLVEMMLTALITAEEVDRAAQKTVAYRAPGT